MTTKNTEQGIKTFIKSFFEAMERIVKEDESSGIVELMMTEATKDNIGKMEGIIAKFADGGNASPCSYPFIYPLMFYKDYLSGAGMDELVKSALEMAKELHSKNTAIDLGGIKPENAEECLYLVLLNKEMNADLMDKCPHIEMEDLIAVPRWRITDKNGTQGSMLVTHDIQSQFLNMSDEEVCRVAREATLKNRFAIKVICADDNEIDRLEGPDETFGGKRICIVSNRENYRGAVAILYKEVMKTIQEIFGEECFFAIADSIHEFYAIPASEVEDVDSIKCEFKDISDITIPNNEKLSDNIYYYDGEKLQICNSQEELQKLMAAKGVVATENK